MSLFPNITTTLKSQPPSTILGLSGLFLFAAFGWVDRVNNDISVFLMLIAAALQYKNIWKCMRHDPLTYIFLIFTLYVLLHAYFSGLSFPETKGDQWHQASKWLRIWFFLLVAWWLDGNSKRIFLILAIAFSGFILQILSAFDWSNVHILLENKVMLLGLNKNATALISGTGLIAIAIFTPRALSTAGSSIPKKIGIIAFILLISAIFIEAMLLTQSRTVWIAVAATLSLLFLYGGIKNIHLLRQKRIAITAAALTTLIVLFLYPHFQKITHSFARESTLAQNVSDKFDINKIPYSSLGRRFHLWHFGLNRLSEKPLIGWGPGTRVTRDLDRHDYGNKLENTEARLLQRHPHLHNTYLITLVRLGLIGALLITIAFVFFHRGIWLEYKKGNIDKQIFIFYLASTFAFLLGNMTMFRLFTQEDRTLIYLIFACAYSYRMASLKRKYT